MLSRLEHTCVLDVVDEQPMVDEAARLHEAITSPRVGELMGVTQQAVSQHEAKASAHLRQGLGVDPSYPINGRR